MKTWICRREIDGEECGQIVVSDTKPAPIKWTDGHVCRFVEEEPRVRLLPSGEEPEEHGVIEAEEKNGVFLVRVDEKYRHGPGDDGLREVPTEQVERM